MHNEFQANVLLAPFTTFKIGGRARSFIKAADDSVISRVFAENESDEIFILGGGSNILISDRGFNGTVLKIATRGTGFVERTGGVVRVTAKAGEDWDGFVEMCVSRGLAGLECMSGIPGLVGGTPIQNVGAYGQEVSETIVSVEVLERASGRIFEIENQDCGFSYRSSIFNTVEKDRYVVLGVQFDLIKNGEPKIVYGDLKQEFGETRPELQQVREAVRRIRESKGMLVRQGGSDSQSAGSFFKNPVVSGQKLLDVESVFAKEKQEIEESVPRFDIGGGEFKVPAAWLIEKSGFGKGFELGNAGISTRHSLALINRGGATSGEIISLMKMVQKAVYSKFGVGLVPEPNFVGFGSGEVNSDV